MASEMVVDLPKPGAVLHDKWVLGARLGQGGMATVFAATHRNGMRGAIKILHPQLVADRDACARLIREGRVANAIDHPGVVRILDDDCTDGGLVYLVMELLEGETLKQRWVARDNQLPLGEVLDHAESVLEILVAAHEKGVVHRDIKPDNVFLVKDGPLKLLDFGIARLKETGLDMTHTGSMLGTPAYMPPEQALAHWDEVDGRSDIFALGATMWTLLTGKMVHPAQSLPELLVAASTKQARPLRSVLPSLPKAAGDVIDRALRFEVTARWPDAASMLAALRDARHAIAVSADSEVPEPPPDLEEPSAPDIPTRPGELTLGETPLGAGRTEAMAAPRPAPRSRRRKAAVIGAGLVFGAIALFAATNAIQSRRDSSAAPSTSAVAPLPPAPDLAPGDVRFAKLLRLQTLSTDSIPEIASLPDQSIAIAGRALALPDWGYPEPGRGIAHFAIGKLDAAGSATDALLMRHTAVVMPGFAATSDGLVMAGSFNTAMNGSSPLDFGCGPLTGRGHAYVASLSVDLTCKWALDLAANGVESANAVAFQPETERIGLLAEAARPIELGGTRIQRKGVADLVFASLALDGSIEWVTSVGSRHWVLKPLDVGFIGTDALVATALVDISTTADCTPEEQKWLPCPAIASGVPALVVADRSGVTARRVLHNRGVARVRALQTRGDRILIGGDFSDSLELGAEPLGSRPTAGLGGAFVAIYDRSLEKPLLQKAIYGSSSASVSAVLFDADGGYFIAGDVAGSLELPGASLPGDGVHDGFVAHYDEDHVLSWAKRFVGGTQTVSGMTLDQKSLYLVVGLEKSATFGSFALESRFLDPVIVALVP